MLRNVLIVKLEKLYTVNYMYSLSALYTLQYVPIVNYSCKLLYSKKKKKKKKKTDPYSGMGKKYQSYATKTPLSIFSLGKGRESLRLQTLHKLSKSALSALPLACILIQTLCGRRTPILTKIDQIKFTLPQLSHLSSNRRVCNLPLYFQLTTPARELTNRTKFVHPERHEFRQCHVSSLPEARETPKILPRKT